LTGRFDSPGPEEGNAGGETGFRNLNWDHLIGLVRLEKKTREEPKVSAPSTGIKKTKRRGEVCWRNMVRKKGRGEVNKPALLEGRRPRGAG